MQLTKQILKLMRRGAYEPSTASQIAALLPKRGFRVEEVDEALKLLEKEGRVIAVGKNRYSLPISVDQVVGEFTANRAGYGFVESPAGDLYVGRARVHGAMNGDTVAVRLLGRRRGMSNEAEVVKVIDRARESVIGRVERRGREMVVVPSDRRIFYELLIAPGRRGDAEEGDMVVALFTVYPDGERGAHGEITEVLGGEDSPTIEIDVIVREHGLFTKFSEEAVVETERVPDEVVGAEIARRKDFRDVFTVTIDGLDAQDFDDAVSLSREGESFRLGIHIADVGHYVIPGSALDADAFARATSVYLADRVLPMLPERLSNGICSLNPRVERLTLSVEMLVDPMGHVKDFEISEGVIRSDHRLTYEEVDKMFESGVYPDDRVRELLTGMRKLSDVLDEKRLDRGALDFETIEPKVILDEALRPVEVLVREKTPATKLIEEAMILTNETVAAFMYWQEAPMVYRVHEKPNLESLTQIEEIAVALDYPVKKAKTGGSRALQKIIEYAHSRPERLMVNHIMLRAMKRALYAPKCAIHFGLASEHYTHFTSPIRRYPDLVVHRLVKAALTGELFNPEMVRIADSLREICDHSSKMEREADAADRESVEVKLCQLMAGHIGEEFEGAVSGITSFGVFVQLANTAEGLVHVRDLPGHFDFNERFFELSNKKTGRVFQIGQPVKVRLTNVLIGERRIDFVLAE